LVITISVGTSVESSSRPERKKAAVRRRRAASAEGANTCGLSNAADAAAMIDALTVHDGIVTPCAKDVGEGGRYKTESWTGS